MIDPVYFAAAALNVRLHPGQERWLGNSHLPENILVTGNRWGKSFVCAVKIIHHALFRPRPLRFDRCGRYRVVTASISQEQANIVFNHVKRFVLRSELLQRLLTSSTRTPYPRLEFGNGSSVEARSTQNRGEYLLGHDYDLFIFDEVAFETDPEYVVENVIQMRLADREGRLDLVSTPNGKNWLYRRVREIKEGNRTGYLQSGDSRENTFISAEFLQDRLRYFSEQRAQQNIMGRFVDSGGEILRGEYVDRALAAFDAAGHSSAVPTGHRNYLSGWDLARKRTATVGITVEVVDSAARIVALERFRRFDWNIIIEKIKQRQMDYPGQLIIDATGLGDVVVEQLREFRPLPVVFSQATKAELLTNVELFHARHQIAYDRWQLPDGPGKTWSLEDELRQARWDDNNECDALMALALAIWPLRRTSNLPVQPRVDRLSRRW